jgi:hypothetical protein
MVLMENTNEKGIKTTMILDVSEVELQMVVEVIIIQGRIKTRNKNPRVLLLTERQEFLRMRIGAPFIILTNGENALTIRKDLIFAIVLPMVVAMATGVDEEVVVVVVAEEATTEVVEITEAEAEVIKETIITTTTIIITNLGTTEITEAFKASNITSKKKDGTRLFLSGAIKEDEVVLKVLLHQGGDSDREVRKALFH